MLAFFVSEQNLGNRPWIREDRGGAVTAPEITVAIFASRGRNNP